MKKIAVIGAGTMGNGIAHIFAQYGFPVTLIDIDAAQIQKALATISGNLERQVFRRILTEDQKKTTLGLIATDSDLGTGIEQADLIIEAAAENLAIKLDIFKKLGQSAPVRAILATNTSSISITQIGAASGRPAAVIGMHFMNPVPVMKLVEVINGYETSPEVTKQVLDLCHSIGKTPCVVNDFPGFIANRVLMPMINEAIIALQEGAASVSAIDNIMKLGMAHPMGPLQLADFIGLDVCQAILNVLYHGFGNPKYAPCPLLNNMVAAGKLGVKTGEGFYIYQSGSKELTVSSRFN